MKTFPSLLLAGALMASALPLLAPPYEITFFSIDGGGGTSSGGNYTLTGTIGQPDAGAMTGGSFALEGGFWGGAFAAKKSSGFTNAMTDAAAKIPAAICVSTSIAISGACACSSRRALASPGRAFAGMDLRVT